MPSPEGALQIAVPYASLAALLDFANIDNQDQVSNRFREIAKLLLLSSILVLRHQGSISKYHLLEIEFYFNNGTFHADPFCHSSPEQRVPAQWYFHKAPTSVSNSTTPFKGYRGGSRKGLDLTMGHLASHPSSTVVSGGILLRSMKCIEDGRIISGPSLLVDEILQRFGCAKIEELVMDRWRTNLSAVNADVSTSNNSEMFITVAPTYKVSHVLYSSPRVGLDLSHKTTSPDLTHPRVRFVAKLYRFYVQPRLLTTNGRVQTFVGLMIENGFIEESQAVLDAADRLGYSVKTARKYISEFMTGMKADSLLEHVSVKGKGVCGSPSRYLRLMGVLQRLQRK